MQQESKPDHVHALERSLLTARIELEALKNDHDAASVQRRAQIEARIKAQDAEYRQLMETLGGGEGGQGPVQRCQGNSSRTRRADCRRPCARATTTRAGQLKHVTIPQLQQRMEEQAKASADGGRGADAGAPLSLLSESVTSEDVAAVVARHTGIPVSAAADG